MAEVGSIRILVVADDRATADVLCDELRGRGHAAIAAAGVAEGLERLRQSDFEVGLVDLMLPDGSGIDVLRQATLDDGAIETIVLTASATVAAAIEAMKLGAFDYVTKPARPEEIEVRVAKAAEKSRLRRENLRLKARLAHLDAPPGLIAEDAAMRELVAAMERVAASEAPVLIQGEGGTGKEIVARAVHRMSPRRGQAFVALPCASVPEDRIEGELFGHEKGASSDGRARRSGLFDVAEGGVLFLDDVGTIAPAVQAKVMRAIEAGEFFRLGGTRPLRADVRLFASSRNDDAFARGAVTLKVPPLRDRPADVPLLAHHFLERFAGRKRLTPRAVEALQRYAWPGNVRELEVLIRRAALLAAKDVIDAEDLPPDVREPGARSSSARTGLSLAEMEKEYIELVLRQNDGHRGKTARALGIDPKTLYNKLGPERPRKKAPAN